LIDEGRAEMESALADFDQNKNIYPTWTVKDVISHLVGWYDAVIASLKAHNAGDIPATPATLGIDHYNASTVSERQRLPYEQIYKEWELSLEQIKQAILEMPAERFDVEMVYPWGPRGSVSQLVKIFAYHEMEHATDIRNMRGKTPVN